MSESLMEQCHVEVEGPRVMNYFSEETMVVPISAHLMYYITEIVCLKIPHDLSKKIKS